MTIHWQILLPRLLVWFALELLLGFLELDELADYSEFLDEQNPILLVA
jgi:fumarate reductase subunit C